MIFSRFLPLNFSTESIKVYSKSENVGKTLYIMNDATAPVLQAHHFGSNDSVQWLFNLTSFSGPSIEAIQNYFSNFGPLDLNSHMYALTALGNKSILFEVYKTQPNANMTISQLCRVLNDLNRTEEINRDSIWQRRTNLTGLKLKVGFIEGSLLVSTSTGVIIPDPKIYFTCMPKLPEFCEVACI